jgi:hypothetical protein
MKRMPLRQSQEARRRRRSPVYALSVVFLGCLLGFGILGPAMPSQSSNQLADLPSALVRRPSTRDSQTKSADGVWSSGEQDAIANAQPQRTDLRSYRRVVLDRNALAAKLNAAPMEFSGAAADKRLTLTLPSPDGAFARFSIAESPIMAPELAARFPEIKTYTGSGLDDPTATTRFDWTLLGFHAIILSEKGTILIEPGDLGDVQNYVVYFQKDVIGGTGECDVTDQDQKLAIARSPSLKNSQVSPAVSSGTNLRTYRLAAAATAEYTAAYGGGTVGGALSAITTTVNLVDAIYEREVAVRLTLIAGETSIIFTDTTTDGYTTDNVGLLIGENQTKINSVIGPANYDIGHVFDGRLLGGTAFSWQGQAGIGVVCVDGSKARGVDIFRSVFPTSLYAYYSTAHEMGHQFSATHTFNATSGTCGGQRTASTAYEPLNGSTIMAYRLACSPEDLNSQDTYFHNASIEQIVNFTTGITGNSCAVTSANGNNPPVVNAGATYTIPMGTPFTLTATGSDPDGDPLTFGWEEFDLGTASPPSTDDGSRPIFRSFLPTSDPSRTFPRLQDVLSGFATVGESLPVTTRTMNFRVTARDNRTGGGGVNSAATQVNVRAEAGPFTVTQPASAATWATGSNQTVNWNVANTNSGSINCANVKITLSTDGGTTFPIVLANNTPNDGSEAVTIPGTPSGTARVKVEGVGNIFFNISQSFTITGSANTIPTISGFAPPSGAVGASVTVNGTNFITPSAVKFNGVSASFTVNSTTQIVATVPSGATTGPITVTNSSGTATSPNNFILTPVYSVNGQVRDGANNPVSGVLITFDMNFQGTPSTASTQTDASGNYSSADLGCQNRVIVTPSKSKLSFSPSFTVFVTNGQCLSGTGTVNFTASAGRTKTGVFRPPTGELFLKNSNSSGFADTLIVFGNPGDYPLAGDWNGDGVDSVGIYRNGVFYLRNSNTTGFADIIVPFGNPGDQPIAGDWDGDGVDTIGIYRNGTFYLRNSNTAGPPDLIFTLGDPGDVGIAGDWNGDGLTTCGVFRPSNGIVYLRNSNTTGFADLSFVYGIAGDKPVAGDWNADGIDTVGIYRDGLFYLTNSNSTGFADTVFALGVNGDFPIAGNWNGSP